MGSILKLRQHNLYIFYDYFEAFFMLNKIFLTIIESFGPNMMNSTWLCLSNKIH